jgi:hypothetical protein
VQNGSSSQGRESVFEIPSAAIAELHWMSIRRDWSSFTIAVEEIELSF